MEGEGPAIRALGSLFKLTEVYIWDDGSKETREVCLFPESTDKSCQYDEDSSLDIPALTNAHEDVELIEQMGALGLPLSFQSNKETRSKTIKGKRKGTRLKLSSYLKQPPDEALESTKVSEMEIVPDTVLHDKTSNSLCCMSVLDQSESYYYDVAADASNSQFPAGEDSASSTKVIGDVIDGVSHDLSTSGYECKFIRLGDVISNNENKEKLSLKNSDAAPSLPCQLTSVDDGEKEIGGSLEHNCLESYSASYHEEKHRMLCSDYTAEQAGISETAVLSQNSEVLEPDGTDSCCYNVELGDWRVFWDSCYMRNYFYNIKTGTSTWDPPTGMEHMACDDVFDEMNVAIAEVTKNDDCSAQLLEEFPEDYGFIDQPSDEVSMETGVATNNFLPGVIIQSKKTKFELRDELHGIIASCNDEIKLCLLSDQQGQVGSLTSTMTEQVAETDIMQIETGDPMTDGLDIQLEPPLSKQEEKAKKARRRRKSSVTSEEHQHEETFEDFSANSGKYWCQRYMLFSKYDSGIKMDVEGWFSVTPELIARHHASRCVDDMIIDCFTGVGGNAIQFALRCKHVTAIDVDPLKIDYANHNAAIYGVDDRIDFIKADFFVLAPKLKADTVFLSPPWGGPDYAKVKKYGMAMLRPHDGYFLFNTAKKIGHKIVMFLPRNVDINELAELSLSANPAWSLEVEKNFLNGKLKAITAYFIDTKM